VEHLIIDSQTLNDLNIFTAREGSNSIFDLFKQTRTLAARKSLKDMMERPFNNLEDITGRRDTIKYFQDNNVELELKNPELDLIEFYLASKAKTFRNNPIDAFTDYVTRRSSNDYYVIKTGQRYLIEVTKYLLRFVAYHEANEPPLALARIMQRIKGIIKSGVLLEAVNFNEGRLTFRNISNLDRALRGSEKESIKQLLGLVYDLDVFENVARVASAKGFSFPVFSSEADLKLNIQGLFHPAIGNPIKNDVYFDQKQNLVLLTGSNMAGKSSLLKSLGLVVYLAHLGFPVPADSVQTTVFNGLVSTINLPDNIHQGLSHYFSEVKRVKEVAEILLEHDRTFVIFDELFRGTNVKDAFDGSTLVISELAGIRNSAFIISTHIIELAAGLKQFDNITFRYLDTHFENLKPVFKYLLKEGVSEERLGMYIVQNEGIVDILRQAANSRIPA
jgi:DNA mismatch repair protein MutS